MNTWKRTIVLVLAICSCNTKGEDISPSNTSSTSQGGTAYYCGGKNQNVVNTNVGSSGGEPPEVNPIVYITSGNKNEPIDFCTKSTFGMFVDQGSFYIPLSSSDSLFLQVKSNNYSRFYCNSNSTDTGENSDHFEFLTDTYIAYDSSGKQVPINVLRKLKSGYKLSEFDTSAAFWFSFSKTPYISLKSFNNNINPFSGNVSYVAFRIYTNSGYKYGWLKIGTSEDCSSSIYEFVYNSADNMPLTIGQQN